MTHLFPHVFETQKRSFSLGATSVAFALIIGMHGGFQALLNPVGVGENAIATWLGFGLMGALISEPVLFGVWGWLGPGALIVRLPITCLVLIALTLAGAMKCWNVWWPSGK